MTALPHPPTPPLRIEGASWLDTATGELRAAGLLIEDGVFRADDGREAETVDGSGLTAMFGLWDCHAHAGGLMYDPDATGYFEAAPDRTIRAGQNFRRAVEMGFPGCAAWTRPTTWTWPGAGLTGPEPSSALG